MPDLLDRDRIVLDRGTDRAHQRIADLRYLPAGNDTNNTRHLTRRRSIDIADNRMRVGRTQDRGVSNARYRRKIVDETRIPAQ